MNKYVLIERKNMETSWYELVEHYDKKIIDRLASKFSKSVAEQFIKGREGLTLDRMDNFLWNYSVNIAGYLNDGKKLLFNRAGGMMFLDATHSILKTVKDSHFPHQENMGLSGWLTPEGIFHPCEHGEHWKFASETLSKSEKDIQELQYVSMGSAGHSYEQLSHLFLPVDGYTEKQNEWLKKHCHFLDPKQKKIYDTSKNRTD